MRCEKSVYMKYIIKMCKVNESNNEVEKENERYLWIIINIIVR